MPDSKEIKTMRYIQWEKVKGSLRAVLQTFWDIAEDGNYQELQRLSKEFVKTVEDKGLVD